MKKCFDTIKFKEKKHHSQTPSERIDLIKLFDPIVHDCFVSRERGSAHVNKDRKIKNEKTKIKKKKSFGDYQIFHMIFSFRCLDHGSSSHTHQ